jgi:uncharacterized protein with HEPN domain
MRDFAAEAVEMAGCADRSALDADRRLFLALTRLVELVGEASTGVDEDTRAMHRSIKETRNRLIHAYDDIDRDVLRQIVRVDLPALVRLLDGA